MATLLEGIQMGLNRPFAAFQYLRTIHENFTKFRDQAIKYGLITDNYKGNNRFFLLTPDGEEYLRIFNELRDFIRAREIADPTRDHRLPQPQP